MADFKATAMSGSLTRLVDGKTYLIAGANIDITTGSDDRVTIVGTGGGGSSEWTRASGDLYPTTSPTTTDVLIGNTAEATAQIVLRKEGGLVLNQILGTTAKSDFIHFGSPVSREIIASHASSNQVLILSGGTTGASPNEKNFPDMAFFVSGTIGSRNTAVKGASVFGGDVLVSGSLTALGAGLSGGSISGSIHHTAGGISYLAQGANVTIASASNGQITISSTGGTALQLYKENPSSPVAPSPTGANAIAMGSAGLSSGDFSTVGGGLGNKASNTYVTIAGGRYNTGSSTYVAVGGGFNNDAFGANAVIAGGSSNATIGQASFIGGGQQNKADGSHSLIAGGIYNTIHDSGGNRGKYSTIVGGYSGSIKGEYHFIGGGEKNNIDGGGNTEAAVIVGGANNLVQNSGFDNGSNAFIGAGLQLTSSSGLSFLGSGWQNRVIGSSQGGAIVAGRNNLASGQMAFIGAGRYLTSSGNFSVVAGGFSNTAGGDHSAILGGTSNTSTANYSILVGHQLTGSQAQTVHIGGGRPSDNTTTVLSGTIVKVDKGADFQVETSDKINAIRTQTSTNQVLILSGGAAGSPNETGYPDVAFFVSGTVGSLNTSVRGVSLFGGDLQVSGSSRAGSGYVGRLDHIVGSFTYNLENASPRFIPLAKSFDQLTTVIGKYGDMMSSFTTPHQGTLKQVRLTLSGSGTTSNPGNSKIAFYTSTSATANPIIIDQVGTALTFASAPSGFVKGESPTVNITNDDGQTWLFDFGSNTFFGKNNIILLAVGFTVGATPNPGKYHCSYTATVEYNENS